MTEPTNKEGIVKTEVVSTPEVKKPKSKFMKFLGKFGTFLMFGGWMLIMVLILGLVIFISVVFKCK